MTNQIINRVDMDVIGDAQEQRLEKTQKAGSIYWVVGLCAAFFSATAAVCLTSFPMVHTIIYSACGWWCEATP